MSAVRHLASARAAVGKGHWPDRREELRFPILPETSAHLVAGLGESSWPGRVLDISTDGLSLSTRCRFDVGVTVPLELANGVRVFCCTLKLKIVHVTEQTDGSFIVGGEFDRRLTATELGAILS
jgi:hypothetical protein